MPSVCWLFLILIPLLNNKFNYFNRFHLKKVKQKYLKQNNHDLRITDTLLVVQIMVDIGKNYFINIRRTINVWVTLWLVCSLFFLLPIIINIGKTTVFFDKKINVDNNQNC